MIRGHPAPHMGARVQVVEQPGAGIDPPDLQGREEAHHVRRQHARPLTAGAVVVLAPDHRRPQGLFGGVIVEGDLRVLDELGQTGPVGQHQSVESARCLVQ